ncbi:hypothetical protein BJ742DRAFT_738425 [Cladochytrium replicatum]|nr:hypothetical protein BJ742DRAFT_738425 [Cladochytrium replicatum]
MSYGFTSRNKEAFLSAGAIPLPASLLESQNEKFLIPVVAILQDVAIRSSGMIKFLVENLSSNNEALQTQCANAILKCAEEDETRDHVRQFGGLNPISKTDRLNTIKKLVGLENQPEEVLVNFVGHLRRVHRVLMDASLSLREAGSLRMLTYRNKPIAPCQCHNCGWGISLGFFQNLDQLAECMAIIDRLDGIRLLWSLLKSTNPHVQASAAWAISPVILGLTLVLNEPAKDAGEMDAAWDTGSAFVSSGKNFSISCYVTLLSARNWNPEREDPLFILVSGLFFNIDGSFQIWRNDPA